MARGVPHVGGNLLKGCGQLLDGGRLLRRPLRQNLRPGGNLVRPVGNLIRSQNNSSKGLSLQAAQVLHRRQQRSIIPGVQLGSLALACEIAGGNLFQHRLQIADDAGNRRGDGGGGGGETACLILPGNLWHFAA
ncbi:hypothetical protein SDC9_163441 [bioreactor metagenome]|uniref:Uncharacterized protein n=1 Tax=bioreactor metagenome TaxID=1076179 RepID=A0A645FVK1_9ZZZZ